MDTKDLVALLAAFVTATFAAAKLIADKESKISDFRKDWISTFRLALSECLAEAHVIAGRIRIRARHSGAEPSFNDEQKQGLEEELTEHWAAFRSAYNKVILHLNFAETGVPLYNSRFNSSLSSADVVWDELSAGSASRSLQLVLAKNNPQQVDSSRRAMPASLELASELEALLTDLTGDYSEIASEDKYRRIDRRILKATLLGNLVIKPEWNRIKKGERGYRWAVRVAGAVIFVAMLGIGYIISTNGPKATKPSEPAPVLLIQRL